MSNYACLLIMQVLANQLHFLVNRNAGLAILPLFIAINCIKIGGHVAILSCSTGTSQGLGTKFNCCASELLTADELPSEKVFVCILNNFWHSVPFLTKESSI